MERRFQALRNEVKYTCDQVQNGGGRTMVFSKFKDIKLLYKLTAISILGVLMFLAGILWYILPRIEDKIMSEKQASTKNLVEMAVSILDGYANQVAEGKITTLAARKAALEDINRLRYAEGNYVWINDLSSTMILHPIKPELNGKNMSDFKDPQGKKIFNEFVTVCKDNGAGFVDYHWPKPGLAKPVPKISYVQLFPKWGWIVGTGVYVNDVAAQISGLRNNLIGFSTIVGLLVVVFAFIASRTIAGQLAKAVDFAKSVANGDLSRTVAIEQGDEIGILAAELNRMAAHLREMLESISGGVKTLLTSSTGLSAISKQIADGSEQSSNKAQSVSQAAEQMNDNMNAVSSASEQTSSNVQMVATAAEQMTATISEIAGNMEKGRRIADDAVEQARTTSTQVGELGQAMEHIGKVTEAIAEISEQTNLLALNATIEAARAGESGKGFAVVANEIKDLANQTADATQKIGEQISSIQIKTGDTVEKINQISSIIHDLCEIVNTVASAMEEQAVATREISSNVNQAAAGNEEVSRNVVQSTQVSASIAQAINQVTQAAREMAAGSSQVHNNAQDLSGLAEQLNQMICRFRV
jgi:methyl-accepting chemotaxis protein